MVHEMEQRNSEKNQKFLVLNDKWVFYLLNFNSRADFTTRYTFNQIRWDTTGKCMNNKFLVLTNIYNCTGYFIGFTFLENVVLLAFASHLS